MEMDRVIKAAAVAGPVCQRAIEFMYETGARASEVQAATWADVDLTRGLWRIRGRGKGADREVALSGRAIDILMMQQWSGTGPAAGGPNTAGAVFGVGPHRLRRGLAASGTRASDIRRLAWTRWAGGRVPGRKGPGGKAS